jgi:hypothetical protein
MDDRQVDLLVWVTAASRTAVLTGYADAHARITGPDDTDLTHAAQRFLTWLAEPHDRRWIIVLDNLDDPDDLIGWLAARRHRRTHRGHHPTPRQRTAGRPACVVLQS